MGKWERSSAAIGTYPTRRGFFVVETGTVEPTQKSTVALLFELDPQFRIFLERLLILHGRSPTTMLPILLSIAFLILLLALTLNSKKKSNRPDDAQLKP